MLMKNLLATKPVEPAPHVDAGEPVEGTLSGEASLKRVLTARQLVMLGIGAVIGAGIFVLTGQAAAHYAGPAVVLSFVIAGIACAFAGLCYAEFASMLPVSGSAYSYAYATLGEGVAWFIGWMLVLEYLFAASTVAVGWSGYLNSFLGLFGAALPDALASAPLAYSKGTLTFTGAIVNLPAVAIVTASASGTGRRPSSSRNRLTKSSAKSMLRASPAIGMTFSTNTDKPTARPINAMAAIAELTQTRPVMTGIIADTAPPNANRRMRKAAGTPNASARPRSWRTRRFTSCCTTAFPVSFTAIAPLSSRGMRRLNSAIAGAIS